MHFMKTSEIKFRIELDETNTPQKIEWFASDATDGVMQETKSIFLSIWDPKEKETLRLDLWTKDMLVEDMDMQFFQTLLTLSETYAKAVQNNMVIEETKKFCNDLAKKLSEAEQQKNKSV